MQKHPPLGVRCNNPLNLRPDGRSKWQGLDSPSTLSVPGQGSYLRFKAPAWGWRAAALNLIAYQDRYGLRTIRGIVERWAPAADKNDPLAYARTVARLTNRGLDTDLDLHRYEHLKPLMEAMATVELGAPGAAWFPAESLEEGLRRAGVLPPPKPLAKAPEVRGAQVSVAGTAGAAIAEAVQQAGEAIQPLTPYLEIAKWAFLALVLIGAGITVWQAIRRHRQAA